MIPACIMNADVYTARIPRKNQYYRCVEAHFEELVGKWDDRYQQDYGYWRPYILDVIYKYLDCGDLHLGFARVKCDDCQYEYLLPFSCKRRYFCPSCHQKRVLEFGEFLYTEVLKQVPHRQWVFSIPKRLRRYFMYDRSLLSKLCRCAWKVLSLYLTQGVSLDDPKPGAVIAVQTFGDFLNFNPHLHIIASDGCFATDGGFMVGTEPDASSLIDLFRGEVFKMLKKASKIDDHIIKNMLSWHHSGFNVYCGPAINPGDQEGLEKLAQYIIRAPLSQERLLYIPASEVPDGIARVIYRGKNSSVRESFMALDWLARLVTHIPNKGEQLVRYYGYYSNKSRGMRKKTDTDVEMPALVESDISKKAFRRNWARLIQKIYHTDPLLCPKCSGHMRIISIIEDLAIVKKILIHLNLWATKNHDPPPISSTDIEYACLQVPLIANEKSLNTCRVKAQEVSHEELPQLSFDEFSDDYVIPMPFEDEYSQWIPYED